jgi:glycosyltransferase involved in cell wall biosynthesis
MRCLVNLFHLDPPSNGGASRVAREVSRMLAAWDQAGQVEVIFAAGWRVAARLADWIGAPEAKVVPCLPENGVTPLIKALAPDIIVSPLFGGEPVDEPALFGSVPHVVSMPDALALDMPELFGADEARRRRRLYAALRHATRVITLSEHARGRLLYHLNVPAERIAVVPLGADSPLPGTPAAPPVAGPFVFYPANNWPHKRHELLLRIMTEIWRLRPEIKLVLTGARQPGFVNQLVERHRCPVEQVIDLGFVSERELATLYRHAEALLFASQYEGFGMPLVEAMANGCPVLCAPLTSIPEVAGHAALYVAGDDPSKWADVFLHSLPAMRSALIERGRRRAQEFTWENTRARWKTHLVAAGLRLTCGRGLAPAPHVAWDVVRAELHGWAAAHAAIQAAASERLGIIDQLQRVVELKQSRSHRMLPRLVRRSIQNLRSGRHHIQRWLTGRIS